MTGPRNTTPQHDLGIPRRSNKVRRRLYGHRALVKTARRVLRVGRNSPGWVRSRQAPGIGRARIRALGRDASRSRVDHSPKTKPSLAARRAHQRRRNQLAAASRRSNR